MKVWLMVRTKKMMLGDCINKQNLDLEVAHKEEQSLLIRLQLAEEMAARQTAQLMIEEKRIKEVEILKTSLEREVRRQHELL